MIPQGIHIIVGSLGDGKTLRSVSIAEWFINNNRRVATNINLRIERLANPDYYPSLVTRIPDKPSIEVLDHLGEGSSKKGEYGLLLLDELAIWMNSRTFQDKDRDKIIRFLIEARKRRWIVIFIAQKAQMIDKQARNLGATIHQCKSTSNIAMLKWLPRTHFVIVRNTDRVKAAATEFYRSKHLYGAYDTEQRFCDSYGGNPGIDQTFQTTQPSRLDRHFAAKNGYYSLLPPRNLNPVMVKRANEKLQASIPSKKKLLATTAILLTICAFLIPLFWSSEQTHVIAQEPESEASLPVAEIITQPTTESFQGVIRIRHSTLIGSRSSYHFETDTGSLISSQELESLGYQVRYRSSKEALIISPTYEYKSIYR